MAMSTNDQRAHVASLLEKWKPRFSLQNVEIEIVFHDSEPGDTHGGADDDGSAWIQCGYTDRYHHAALNVRPDFFEADDEEQTFIIVHELSHVPMEIVACLIDRFRRGQFVTPAEQETAVERATNLFAKAIAFSETKTTKTPKRKS